MVKKCPICKSDDYETLISLCSNMNILGSHFKDEPANIVCCKKCGLVFMDIDESQAAFNKHYDSEWALTPSYDELYTPEVAQQYFDDWYNEIKDYINYDSYIADIGGGLGHFGQYLKKLGYKNIYLFDISKTAVKSASEKGLEAVLCDGIDIDEKYFGKFDLVMYSNSLEHFYNLDEAVAGAKRLMKDTGYFYIELPDADEYCETKNSSFMLFTLEHLYHFNLNTMANLARVFGFEIVDKKQTLKCGGFNILRTVFKNAKTDGKYVYDDSCKKAINKYIDFSKDSLKIVDKFKKSQEPLILWGIGASTVLLLNNAFDDCNVIQLVDRNKARQGLKFKIADKTFAVEDPSAITNKEATIIVLPFWYRASIIKTIQSYKYPNKIEVLM